MNNMIEEFNSQPLTGWYPGHMLKAGRKIKENLKLIDLAVEMLDARLPQSSINPNFKSMLSGKPSFMLLNKSDLADPAITAEWKEWFLDNGYNVAVIDARSGHNVHKLPTIWKRLIDTARKKSGAKYKLMRPPRILIAGIPNIGKSTLVNRLASKKRAAVGPRPGVTRNNQWLKLKGGMELMDTPGVFWPKITNKCHELKLAAGHNMNDKLVGLDLICKYLLWQFKEQPEKIKWQLYGLDQEPENIDIFLGAIAKKRGLLLPGGELDIPRCAFTCLKDFRDGKLGRISLERP